MTLFRDPRSFAPIRNSLWMSAVATAANLVWGLVATFWLRRRKDNLRRFADLLIVLPWSAFWERNYFAESLPLLQAVVKNNFVRGAVSGIGVLNLVAGLADLRMMMPWERR